MNLAKYKPWQIDLAAAGVCVLLAVIAYVVGVHPVIKRHQGFDLRAAELKVQQKKARQLSGKVAHIASAITQIKQELANNTVELKSASQINSHLARLAALTGQCGLKIDQLRPGKSLNGSRYQTVPIYLVGSGSFSTCVKLLRELQRGFPDTSVASFEVKGDPTKPNEPTKLRVDLLWYALPDVDLSKG
ncbi:MAG: type 4a pilus biogenesis protein PilO [Phycisphaerae bacterium]|jgi:Tfp pilus assembly protein PilO|nr:type 4a pilus biogenesis protein PilO [Phycisphaerae bacterium]